METDNKPEKKESSKTGNALKVLLVLLTLALVGETVYLFRIKNTRPSAEEYPGAVFPPAAATSLNLLDEDFGNWEPFREMERIQDQINHIFRDSFRRGFHRGILSGPEWAPQFFEPALDIQDKGDHYVVKMDIPGMEKDRLSIEVTENYLKVSGERNAEDEKVDKRRGYFRMERSFGHFERMVPLPADVNTEDVAADYTKGVLTVKLPKIQKKSRPAAVKSVPVI